MVFITIAVAALLTFTALAPRYLRVVPLIMYPLYRFGGTLSMLTLVGAWMHSTKVDSTEPQVLLLFLFPGIIFLSFACAKAIGVVCWSDNARWWMIILKSRGVRLVVASEIS